MKRIATALLAMAAAIATFDAHAQQSRPGGAPSWLARLYGVPGPKVNFGSCLAPVAGVQLTPASLNFGTIAAPSSTAPQRVTLKNVGNNILRIFSINTSSMFEGPGPFVIAANTCPVGGSITPGATCDIDIRYDAGQIPTTFGQVNGVLQAFTNAPSSVASSTLTGNQTAQPVPIVNVQPTDVDFGYLPVATTSAAQAIQIKNVGNAPMPTTGLVTNNPEFAITSHNCAVVPPGGTCTANVTYTPSFTGPQSSFLQYRYTHPIFGADTYNVPLTGYGLAATADILVSPSFLDFGSITVASSVSSGVDVTNSGNTPLALSNISITGSFGILGTTCGAALAPAATCNIAIAANTGAPGAISGTLNIANSSVANPSYDVPISAFVVPNFTVVPPFHDFGNVFTNPTPVPTVTVSLTNNDPIAESISFSSQIFGANFTVGPGGPTPCGGSLGAGQTCTFVIGFNPSLPGGYFGPTIAIKDGAGANTWYDFSAIGIGVQSGPSAQFTSSFLDFGAVVQGGAPVTQTVDFTNVGNQPMSVASFTVNAPYSVVPQVGFCAPGYPTINVGQSCRLAITFTPPASVNSFLDTVQVNDSTNGVVGSVDVFAFTTNGPTPAVDFYPAAVDFGNVGVNRSSAPVIVSFGNTGQAPFNITTPPTVTGPFLLSSTCPATLNPGDCCAFTATYTPRAPGGPDTGTISVATDVGGSTTYSIPLAGVGVPPPSLNVVPIVLPDTRTGTTSGPTPVVVTNVGVTAITITSIAFSLPPQITPFDPAGGAAASAPAGKSGKRGAPSRSKASALPACFPGMTLAIGAACGVDLWFAPANPQNYSGTVTVTYSGGAASPAVFPVAARGIPPTSPDIALSSDLVDFTGVVINTGATQRLAITSAGTAPLNVTNITVFGPFTASNDCRAPLEPGTSCFVDIGFRPDALRTFTGELVIEYEPQGSFRVVRLTGTGINVPKPQIQLSAGSLAFGSLRVGARSAEQSLTVRNVGTATLTISGITATPGFVVESPCTSLAPNGSCPVTVRFAPLGGGHIAGSIGVGSNDPDRPTATVDVSGTGCRLASPSSGRNLGTGCGP